MSERLPLKPEWEDDAWQMEIGTLPAGISFNSKTLSFEGTPSEVTSGARVTLYGYDAGGERIARANVTFDIYNLPENSLKVDLYAHTSRYYNTTINLPTGVVVDNWQEIRTPPAGIDYNGRYVEGTPTQAGRYTILNIGYNYNGDAIFSYYGSMLVEDGPAFPVIADKLRGISYQYGYTAWNSEELEKVVHAVKDPSKVRYGYELSSGETMPGTLRFTNDPYDLRLHGRITDYYNQARVRLKAEDTDGAIGYSNWFQVGSLGPDGVCTPTNGRTSIQIYGVVGETLYRNGYRIPTAADSAAKSFSVVSGNLPQGISLDPASGLVSGVPALEGKQDGVMVRIDFPGNANAQPVTCGPYDFQISAAAFALDMTGARDQYRIGEDIDIALSASGAPGGLIAPYTITMEEDNLPATVSFDPNTGKLTGNLAVTGSYSARFVLTNGDGVTRVRELAFSVHEDLRIDDVAALVSIPQYNTEDALLSVSYDQATIIGSARVQLMGGPMPAGIAFNENSLVVSGGTRLPSNTYGPFFFRLTDSSGSHVDGNSFHVEVTQREDIVAGDTVDPAAFSVNLQNSVKAFSVTQPSLATDYLPLAYTLSGPALPEGLTFDGNTGLISGIPVRKETISGYAVRIDEISPANLSKTSDTFSIEVSDPPPIGEIALGRLQGNSNGTAVISADPTPVLSQTTVARKLVGGVGAVTFVSATPNVPGLSFNAATGQLIGVATSEFEGDVSITFTDGGGRTGTLVLPVKIHPYPALKSSQALYELPRLANASDLGIKVEPANSGFYAGVAKYELAPGSDPLPSGLSLDSTGAITGQTTDAVDTIRNIVVQATSTANGLTTDHGFTIKVTPRTAPELAIPTTRFKVWLNEQTGAVVNREAVVLSRYLKGSYVKPVTYQLGQDAPAWLTINPTNGAFGGTPPTVGDWDIEVIARDTEGATATGTVNLRATLDGYVQMTPGGQELTVRRGETFETQEQFLSNVVRPAEFVANSRPAGLVLDQQTGEQRGRVDSDGVHGWTMNVKDAHDRTLKSNATFRVTVVSPLALPAVTKNEAGRQYDPGMPLDIQFQAAGNAIGKIDYGIDGNVPGTLYYQSIDKMSGLATFHGYDNGTYIGFVDQMPEEALSDAIHRLEPDALVFDPEALTLKGIPSQSGTFTFSLVAIDSHASEYLDPSDPTRISHNEAERSVTVSVAPAVSLAISNSASSEVLHQYTSLPTLHTAVGNAAYGRGVTWTSVSGELPTNVTANKGFDTLGYGNYAESQGTYSNIVWRARDVAGREIVSEPVSFTVGPRQTMELATSTGNPRYMIVFDQDADMTVSAKNAAYGPNIGVSNWVVTGAGNLPPGVSYTISGTGVRFTGTSDVIGNYSGIKVRGTDRLGATATIDLVFSVVSNPEPIELTVFDIVTKPGYPVEMAAPFALGTLSTSNTYGDIRFYSYDLPQELTLAGAGGQISGSFPTPRDLTFDLYVTDDTNRVTSKPVNVSVIPNLRILVPAQVDATQGYVLNHATATDYALGMVSYEKGNGSWPVGIDVDPSTGALVSSGIVTAASGEYPGLTIRATDVFGVHTDVQHSNPFTILVETTPAKPDIIDPAKTILGTQNSAIVAWKPTVREQGTTKAWNYGGTVYTASHDLSAYGLTFNPSTGEISGTAHTPFIIRDFTITVTSQRGDADTTTPFWIGVAPAGNIVPAAGHIADYAIRKGDNLSISPVAWDNFIGNGTFTTSGGGADVALSANGGLINATSTSGWTARENIEIKRTIWDEFGRYSTASIFLDVHDAVSITKITETIDLPLSDTLAGRVLATASNVIGTASYTVSGLPSGLDYDPTTGSISGKIIIDPQNPSSPKSGDQIPVTITVTDSYDGKSANTSVILALIGAQPHRYWKMTWDSNSTATLYEFQILGFDGTNHSLKAKAGGTAVGWASKFSSGNVDAVVDGDIATSAKIAKPAGFGEFGLDFGASSSQWVVAKSAYVHFGPGSVGGWNVKIYYSDDNQNWTEVAQYAPVARYTTLPLSQ